MEAELPPVSICTGLFNYALSTVKSL